MSSNNNWVCFKCKYSKREIKRTDKVAKCLYCKEDLYCLGYKVAIPKKNDLKNWKYLKEESFKRDITSLERYIIEGVRKKHQIEKEIIRLKKLNDNKENQREIKRLETHLSKLN